jgi:hypothetical protein
MIHITMAVAIMTRCISALGILRRNRTAMVRVNRTKYIPGKAAGEFLRRKRVSDGLP